MSEPKPEAEAEPEPEPGADADAKDDGGPLGKGLPWRDQRREIAEEPGNHGRFAFGCSVAVAAVLIAFFVVRMFLMR
ncbi:MAG: hypothetical protein ABI175_01945 [Polyangiales bacterium]